MARDRLPITDPTSEWADRARERYSEPFTNDRLIEERWLEGLNTDPLYPDVKGLKWLDPSELASMNDEAEQEARANRLGLGISDLAKLDRYVNMIADPLGGLFGAGRAGNLAATAAQAGAGYLKEDPVQFWASLGLAPGALRAARMAAPAGAFALGTGVADPAEAQGAELPKGFFSPLMELAKRSKMKRAPGSEWSGWLKPGREVDVGGVKWPLRADELEHSGLYPLFQRDKPVTQDEVLEVLGQRPMPSVKNLGTGRFTGEDNWRKQLINERGLSENMSIDDLVKYLRERREDPSDFFSETPTHYSSYKLPGPTSGYEESLTKWGTGDRLPATDAELIRNFNRDPDLVNMIEEMATGEAEATRLLRDPNFLRGFLEDAPPEYSELLYGASRGDVFTPSAGHFASEPNLLSHSRASTRRSPAGEKVRLVEEFQSDWHQQGRDQGYKIPLTADEKKEFDRIMSTPGSKLTREEKDYADSLTQRDKLPPRAPYADTYHELELRKQLLRAVEEGDDYLALTTGDQQAKRYGEAIQQKVHEVGWNKDNDGYHLTFATSAGKELNLSGLNEKTENLDEGGLRRLLGREMADKIIAGGVSGHLRGDDLKVGGTGMRLWYDEKGPAYLKRLAQALGGEVTTVKVPSATQLDVKKNIFGTYNILVNGRAIDDRAFTTKAEAQKAADELFEKMGRHEVPALKLTPKLKAYVKQHGLPLFSAAGATLFGAEPVSNYLKKREGGT